MRPLYTALIVIAVIIVGLAAYYLYQLSVPIPTTTPPATISPTPTSATPTKTTPTVKYSIVIGTGGVGGVYFYYGQVVAGIINNYTDISATSIQTAASIDNLLLIRDKTDLSKGVIYCATTLPDSAYLAYTGQHDKFKNATAPIAILWVMYPNYLHIVTTEKTGIKSIYDLKGKRVSTGAPGSGTEVTTLMLLKVVGIDPAKDFSKWERLGAEESAAALLDGRIDAYFWSGGLPTGSVVDLANNLRSRGDNIYLISIPQEIIDKFSSMFPGIAVPGTIKKEVYGAREDAKTLAFWNMFVCHKDTPEDVAYKITKAVFEHLDILHASVKAAKDTRLDTALLYINGTIPYHPGALKYYKEIGLLK
ncbi:MAG: TAXI family TRAP transporter solute-binding subunit [Sulfolobales archaeon]